MVKIISLGLGDEETLTLGALKAAKEAKELILETSQAPVADYLKTCGIAFSTIDRFYIGAASKEEAEEKAARYIYASGNGTFAVLGEIYDSEVARKVMKMGAESLYFGSSAAVRALVLCGAYTKGKGRQTLSAQRLAEGTPFSTKLDLVITEIESADMWNRISSLLLGLYPPEHPTVICDGRSAMAMKLVDVGSLSFHEDTVLVLRPVEIADQPTFGYEDLLEIMRRLRKKDGCPWDREQTHETLRPYLLEESYEVMDAIDRNDMMMLADELGDVMLQIAFHCVIGEEEGDMEAREVTTSICKKLIHRHPHIFGSVHVDSARDVAGNWEDIKRQEKGQRTYTDALRDVPRCTSQLIRSSKIQKKAGLVGFDFDNYEGAAGKVREELEELLHDVSLGENPEHESGDLLFAVVNLLRLLKVSPDAALNRTCNKFIERFAYMEEAAKKEGRDLKALSIEEQENLWQAAKKQSGVR